MGQVELQRLSSSQEKAPDIRCQVGIPIRASSSFGLARVREEDEGQVAVVPVARVRWGVQTDANGLMIGRWKDGLFESFDSGPNTVCSYFCPCVSLGQITARMGFGRCWLTTIVVAVLVLSTYFCLSMSYVTRNESNTLLETTTTTRGFEPAYHQYFEFELNTKFLALAIVPLVLTVAIVVMIRRRIRHLLSIPGATVEDFLASCCCMSCSIAQMATHTSSYGHGYCPCAPLPTLPGYVQTRSTEQLEAVTDQVYHPSDPL